MLYAAPPFRLKERPFIGILADALYAHALPCLLAALTFIEIAEVSHHNKIHVMALVNAPFLISLTAWQFFLGLRNILLHQLEDMDNDIMSGTKTFATRYGKPVTDKCLLCFILQAEIISLGFFFICLTGLSVIFPVAYLFFAVYQLIAKGIKRLSIRSFCYNFLDDFYMDWLPLAALIALVLVDWRFVFLFLVHVCLFRNILRALYQQYVLK